MACCGQTRAQIRTQSSVARQTKNSVNVASVEQPSAQVKGSEFQYIGKTAMTALGLATGRQYRFAYPGAILQVDPRDRPSLSAIPNLRQVRTTY
jgi:hypothetical protein